MMSGNEAYSIRDARSADRPRIGALWGELMRLHRALDPRFAITSDGEQKYIRHVQDMMRSRDARVLVAEDCVTKVVIAFLLAEIQTRPPIAIPGIYGFISDVCVQETWRHQGVGRALFEEIRLWFAARRVVSVELYIAEHNPDSAAFWQAMGFEPFLKLMHLDL